MNIHEESELLSAYEDQQLKPEQAGKLAEHIKTCASCRAKLNQIRALKAALKKMPKKKIPAALVTSLEARASEKLSQRTWLDWVTSPRVWVPAAALSLGVMAFALWMSPNQPEDEIPVESLMAAHHRYVEEGPVPSSDLSSGNFSAKLASYEGSVE